MRTRELEYSDMTLVWQRCRDAIAGEPVRIEKTSYLPKISPYQTDAEYQIYWALGYYFNGIGRVFDGLFGMLNLKAPTVEVPPQMEELLTDVSLTGKGASEFIRELEREVLTVDRAGIFIDYPMQGQAESLEALVNSGARPRLDIFTAEEILEVKQTWANGRYQPVYIKLDEGLDDNDKHIFRELILDENGLYRQIIKVEGDTLADFPVLASGRALDFLPFVFVDSKGGSPDIDYPILLDAVNANIKLYQAQTELYNARHLLASPTPYFFGFSPDEVDGKIRLGTNSGIVSSNPDAKTGFLSLGADGISELRQAVVELKEEIALLGGRILAGEKRAVESGEAAAIHRSGENSVLAGIAVSIGQAMQKALVIASLWTGGNPEQIKVHINQDFDPARVDAGTLVALSGLADRGKLGLEAFYQYLARVGLIPDGMDFEEYRQDVERSGAVVSGFLD